MARSVPVCRECGRPSVPRSSNKPYLVQVGDEEPQRLRGQNAALARFLCSPSGEEHPWDSLYQALGGSSEVTRVLRALKKKGINYTCRLVPKRSGKGSIGLYSFGTHIKGQEPEDVGEQSGETAVDKGEA